MLGVVTRGLMPAVVPWPVGVSFQVTQRLRQLPPLVVSEALCLAEECLSGCAGANLILNIGGKFVCRSKHIIRWHAENRTQEDDRVGCWWWQPTVFHFADIREIQASALCQLALG